MKNPLFALALALPLASGCAYDNDKRDTPTRGHSSAAPVESGFKSLFDGTSLTGWKFVGKAGQEYKVRGGNIVCEDGVQGNLFTEKDYENFVFRFEFKLDYGSNNGVGIRAPLEGDAAYVGMEIQILEESGAVAGKWGKLKPEQYHGSVYGVAAAKLGAMKKPGEWNTQEIVADGRRIKVTLNGKVITDFDLNSVTDAKILAQHPGMLRPGGHIGFLGHNDHVEIRNLRVKRSCPPASPRTTSRRMPVSPRCTTART